MNPRAIFAVLVLGVDSCVRGSSWRPGGSSNDWGLARDTGRIVSWLTGSKPGCFSGRRGWPPGYGPGKAERDGGNSHCDSADVRGRDSHRTG